MLMAILWETLPGPALGRRCASRATVCFRSFPAQPGAVWANACPSRKVNAHAHSFASSLAPCARAGRCRPSPRGSFRPSRQGNCRRAHDCCIQVPAQHASLLGKGLLGCFSAVQDLCARGLCRFPSLEFAEMNHRFWRQFVQSLFGLPIAPSRRKPRCRSCQPRLVELEHRVAPATLVTNISPALGLTTGGTSVLITGANLSGASVVDFGTVAATSFTVNSATTVTAVAPPEPAGLVNVTVTAPGGVSATSTADQFTYVAVLPTSTIATDQPLFTWPTGSGAVSYDIDVVDNTNKQAPPLFVQTIPTGPTSASYQTTIAQALTPGHSYTWYFGGVASSARSPGAARRTSASRH